MSEPFSTRCKNRDRYDQWTCPGCYHDLPNKCEGETVCPECKRNLRLSLEEIPTCASYLLDDEGFDL